LKNLLKNRTALSTVVTTLIILVVSVLLAGVVTYFAINVTSTRVQEESLNLQYPHIWFDTITGQGAEAAVMITNTGGRDVVIDKIAVRGQTVPWKDVFVDTATVDANVSDLKYATQTLGALGSTTLSNTSAGLNGSLTVQSSPVVLASGYTMILYMASDLTPSAPGSVTVNDVGLTIAISVFTAQATYYKETNVNAAP
jgi:hypothetical protein